MIVLAKGGNTPVPVRASRPPVHPTAVFDMDGGGELIRFADLRATTERHSW